MKCTEWTLQRAIPALEQSGLLYPNGVPQTQSTVQATAAATSQTQAQSAQQQTSAWTWDETRQKYYYYDYTTQKYVWQD